MNNDQWFRSDYSEGSNTAPSKPLVQTSPEGRQRLLETSSVLADSIMEPVRIENDRYGTSKPYRVVIRGSILRD